MFQILSDLSLLLRKELDVDDTANDVLASGVSGTWVTLNSSSKAVRTTGTSTELAWPVFNESARDQSVLGWTPDVTNSKKVTVLAGKYFARTDQYTSVTAVGPLKTGANGKLANAVEGSTTNVVAYCVKAPYSTNYLGNTLTVIDIYVL
jgi:hypothetical protein